MTTDDHDSLTTFMHRWAEAIVSNDVAQMAEFTTQDWVLVDKPGAVTRESFHEAVGSGRLRHDRMTHEVLDIAVHGHVAVIRTRGRNSGSFDGEPIEADEWTTDVLLRQEGRWRCMLTHLTPVGG